MGFHLVVVVISMCKPLAAVRNADGLDELLLRIPRVEDSAFAELTAAYLCMLNGLPTTLKLGIPAIFANRKRVQDFYLRQHEDPWVYVEVTALST
jgi:hypothetical protein